MDALKSCHGCGQTMPNTAVQCPSCGTPDKNPLPRAQRRLYRGHPDKLVAGVCAALAHRLGVDTVLVRVLFGIAAVVSFGMAFWVYLLLWILLPVSPEGRSPAARMAGQWKESFGGQPRPGDHHV